MSVHASGSGSGYIHRRSQSMAINATEQEERINCFLYRSPLLLKSSMFIKIVLCGHYNHV